MSDAAPTQAPIVTGLTGVYHADGSLLGELRYFVRARLGQGHCSLCDLTHGTVREKRAWRELREAMPVFFNAVHLDERSEPERVVSEGRTPCVLAHTDEGVELLLGPEQLAACAGDPVRLVAAVHAALEARAAG